VGARSGRGRESSREDLWYVGLNCVVGDGEEGFLLIENRVEK